ncbi:MAG TPA: type VI secretion system Vgr family protein [Tepidisphaeraceae bacterium]|jgi:type VI secretion system secreted protein VgrG
MPTYSQEGRLVSIDTPLGKDVLLLTGFTGQEQLSALFHFDLELSSENDSISPVDIVGKNVTLSVRLLDDSERKFNGFISRFVYTGHDDRLSHYRAEVVPWLWFLTRTTDCRIFQNKTVKDIAAQIFSDLGFSDFDDSGVSGPHPTLDYCVQYRETDFNFVSRLLEQEGIFYFFRHEDGKHTLVLADQKDAYQDCPENTVPYFEEPDSLITSWEHGYEFRSGKYSQTEYNFETPSANLMTKEATVLKLDDISKYDLYDYPGGYRVKGDGQSIAKARMEEDEAAYDMVTGAGRCRTFFAGGKFTVTEHPNSGEKNKAYALVSVRHRVSLAGSYVTGGGAGDVDYHNVFTCIPDSVIYRPTRSTPKPTVRGVQPALVVGPAGEEIYTDKYGRVKVQFFWDREGKKNESSSCWVRVCQPMAGNCWGAIYLPRIGQEVIVDFLEGDPDQPIITGRVYNAEQMPPYDLPANATQSGIKTRSSKGGAAANFNELRFEDKKGSEDIYFHAEKDFHRFVENDDDLQVEHDQTITIKNDRTETVKEGNETQTIEKGDRSITVKIGNDTHTISQGNRNVTVEMGNDALTIKMGNQTTKLNLGSSQTEAMQSIELKVGQSSIKIDQMGVTIKGMMIDIEGQVQTQLKGLMTQISADAMLQAKGAITMIG